MQAVLRAEVGDRAGQVVGVALLEPVAGAVGHVVVEVGQDVVVLGQERRVVEEPRPLGRAADDRHGIPIAVPGMAVDEAPQATGPRVPGPVQVVGQAAQSFESGRQREGRRPRPTGRGLGPWPAMIAGRWRRVNRFSSPSPCAADHRSAHRTGYDARHAAHPRRDAVRRVRAVGEDRWSGRRRRRAGARPGSASRPTSRRRWTSSCRATGTCPEPDDGHARRPSLRVPDPRALVGQQRGLDRRRRGRRLPAAPRGSSGGVRSRGLLRRCRRRLRRQRVAVRPVLPGGPGGAARRRRGRSTCSTSTTGTPDRRRSGATSATPTIPIVGEAAMLMTLHNLAYHGWTPRERVGQLGPARRRRHRPGRRHRVSTSCASASSDPSSSTRSRRGSRPRR